MQDILVHPFDVHVRLQAGLCWWRRPGRAKVIQDDSWWYKMIQDGSWWYKMIHDDTRWFMMIQDDTRWYKMIHDDTRWYMMIQDDIWWYKMVHDRAAIHGRVKLRGSGRVGYGWPDPTRPDPTRPVRFQKLPDPFCFCLPGTWYILPGINLYYYGGP